MHDHHQVVPLSPSTWLTTKSKRSATSWTATTSGWAIACSTKPGETAPRFEIIKAYSPPYSDLAAGVLRVLPLSLTRVVTKIGAAVSSEGWLACEALELGNLLPHPF